MDRDGEQLLRRRVYGADHDQPGPRRDRRYGELVGGPLDGLLLADRRYGELVGGPLDGLLLDITGWTQDEVDTGVALATELGQFGSGGRVLYDLRPGDRARWDWGGDTP